MCLPDISPLRAVEIRRFSQRLLIGAQLAKASSFPFFFCISFSRKGADFLRLLLLFSVLALIFVNGWTDAPNAIAGVVATGSMPYRTAARMAAACNLSGALLFCLLGGQVAKTIQNLSGFSQAAEGGLCALAGCFLSVVLFAAAAWRWGIPTSESHGLMAGILGSSLALGDESAVCWQDW